MVIDGMVAPQNSVQTWEATLILNVIERPLRIQTVHTTSTRTRPPIYPFRGMGDDVG